jgi:hypothetical protein
MGDILNLFYKKIPICYRYLVLFSVINYVVEYI